MLRRWIDRRVFHDFKLRSPCGEQHNDLRCSLSRAHKGTLVQPLIVDNQRRYVKPFTLVRWDLSYPSREVGKAQQSIV